MQASRDLCGRFRLGFTVRKKVEVQVEVERGRMLEGVESVGGWKLEVGGEKRR
jgi:hypothetical protein